MRDWQCSPEIVKVLTTKISQVETDQSLKSVLKSDFPNHFSNVPISGGWGYSVQKAIKFNKSEFSKFDLADYVSLEFKIAKFIIFEELIVFRNSGDQYSGINLSLLGQSLIKGENNSSCDKLDFNVSCWHEWYWDRLEQDYKQNIDASGQIIDKARMFENLKKKQESQINYQRTLYFDISEFL